MTPTVIGSITSVFTEIGNWIGDTITSVGDLFYNTSDGLTLIGTMAVASLGIAVVMLIFNKVKSFVQFRG